MSKNDGGLAFPSKGMNVIGSAEYQHKGMTLRDYFAAKALAFVIARHWEGGQSVASTEGMKTIADLSYGIADAMIAERSKP